MIKCPALLVLLIGSLALGIASGGDVGEPAPPLVVKEWVKGSPVEIKPGTNIFVVEIWESSIPECRACITNLNNLQKRFEAKGVVLVAVTDEKPEKIKHFIETVGTNIEYRVAADDRGKTAMGYMKPIEQRGLPFAFVVGTNNDILWRGHPLVGLEQALARITSGQYDVNLAAKLELAAHQMGQYLYLAQRGDFRANDAGLRLLANRTNDPALLCDMAYQIATAPKLPKRDFALAGEALDQAEKLELTNKGSVMITRAVWLFASGKQDAGLLLATQALASAQSPQVKTNLQLFIRTMEVQLAQAKTNHPGPVPAPKPASAVNTNPPPAK